MKELLDKILTQKTIVSAVPKKDMVLDLPYLGELSLQIRTTTNDIMKNKLPYCSLWFVFQCKISNFLKLK